MIIYFAERWIRKSPDWGVVGVVGITANEDDEAPEEVEATVAIRVAPLTVDGELLDVL